MRYTDPSGHWYYDPGCDCLVKTDETYNEHPEYLDYDDADSDESWFTVVTYESEYLDNCSEIITIYTSYMTGWFGPQVGTVSISQIEWMPEDLDIRINVKSPEDELIDFNFIEVQFEGDFWHVLKPTSRQTRTRIDYQVCVVWHEEREWSIGPSGIVKSTTVTPMGVSDKIITMRTEVYWVDVNGVYYHIEELDYEPYVPGISK